MDEKRYMVTAKRVDTGETIRGYYVGPMGCTGTRYSKHSIYHASGPRTEIDPDTIEPVRVKPIAKNTGHFHCPSCNVAYLTYTEDGKIHNTTPFCGNCGIRLDWEGVE